MGGKEKEGIEGKRNKEGRGGETEKTREIDREREREAQQI